MQAFLNGVWRDAERAAVPLADLGFQFGLGVFTTLRVRRSAPVFMPEHLARLAADAQALGFQPPLPERISAVLQEGIRRNRLTGGKAKIITTAGVGARPVSGGAQGTLYVMFARLPRAPASVRILLTSLRPSLLRGHKTLAYLDSVELLRRARKARCHDALALDLGALLETSNANLFIATARGVFTPPADGRILPGIARHKLLQCAALKATERVLGRKDLRRARAVFITNSVRGPVAVESIVDESGREIWQGGNLPTMDHVTKCWRKMLEEK